MTKMPIARIEMNFTLDGVTAFRRGPETLTGTRPRSVTLSGNTTIQSITELQLAALVAILYPDQTVHRAVFYDACRKGKVLLRFTMP